MTSDHFDELQALLLDWEEGTLDDDGLLRLRELLKSSDEARVRFSQLQMLNAALHLEGAAQLSGVSAPDEPETRPLSSEAREPISDASVAYAGNPRRRSQWFSAVAALLVMMLGGRLAWLEFGNQKPVNEIATGAPLGPAADRDPEHEATSQGVAVVTRLVDVDWSDTQQPVEVGEALPPGRLAIDSGFAQIEFFCGATVVLEGPAELQLESVSRARVRSGRLRAQVPPAARGFSLDVDDMTVVDLGTEFALSVSDSGANVQVFDGEVELHQPTGEKQALTSGEAVVRSTKGALEKTSAVSGDFLDISTLERRSREQRAARLEHWREWSQNFRSDPRLITYYAFDQNGGWQRKLRSSLAPADNELDGAIVGARQTTGRWLGKRSLEFKQPGDRVRVQIPGEFSSLTFACWVKIDSLDRWYNSLFLTDNYNKGEPHWQILDTGQLFFSVRVREEDSEGPPHKKVLSPPFWNPSMSGKWMHLATTYSVNHQLVTHYLNGKKLHEEKIPNHQVVPTTRIGRATIGNWSSPMRPDAHFAIRNLNGSIDEFALFDAALTAEEIREMYDNGKP